MSASRLVHSPSGAILSGVETRYIYDPWGNLLAEADGLNNITRKYIYGKGLLAFATPDARYCYHFNGTGSTVALTDVSQAVVNSYAYEPFGQILAEQETVAQPFKFVGQYGVMAEPNGLYYMRARYYDPSVGRFISEDPLGFGGGDVNLFAYVGNEPINWIDPDGKLPLPLVTGGIGFLFGGIGNAASQIIANNGFSNFSFTNLSIAAGTGFLAGAAAPFVATSYLGAATLGASANVLQTAATNTANGRNITEGLLASGLVGGFAGILSGTVTPVPKSISPWLDTSIANFLNNEASVTANVTGANLLRNLMGAAVSNVFGGEQGGDPCAH